MTDERLTKALELYERATFEGDQSALTEGETLLDAMEADVALARGRLLHAKFLATRIEDPAELTAFERATTLYVKTENPKGEAEARFWTGMVHQVIRGDNDSALPEFERAHELAEQTGDTMTRGYAARHLGFHAQAQGDADLAKQRFEESLRLRRELGHGPAIAAALLPLAGLAAESGDKDEAGTLLTEAEQLAEAAGAAGVLQWIAATRGEIAG